MTDYVAEVTGDALGAIFEVVRKEVGDNIDDANLTNVVLAGSFVVDGQHFDFGISADCSGSRITANHFVNKADGSYGQALTGLIDDYYSQAKETILHHTQCDLPIINVDEAVEIVLSGSGAKPPQE